MRIFLIGMMGSGKSYCAKSIAKKLKLRAYDLDNLIEITEDLTISEIFAEEGEAYFRNLEAKVLRWFDGKKNFVLATGGGTPCFHDNIEWMNENGITVWLNEPVDVLVERLKPEKAHRPLISELTDDQLGVFLTKKLAERAPFYSKAKHAVAYSAMKEKDFIKLLEEKG